MKTVILDTNFLLIPHQFKINILAELERLLQEPHEIVVCTSIIEELRKIAEGRGKDGVAARVALEGIAQKKIKVLGSKGINADDWIIQYCEKQVRTIVCTNDVKLRKELKKIGARIITMRTRTKIFWA